MRQIFFGWVIIFILFLGCDTSKQKEFVPTINKIKHLHNFYKGAEHFKYSVQYGLINAGEININVDQNTFNINNIICYQVKASAQLKSAIGLVFNLNDFYESFIDTSTLLPLKFSRSLQENKYKKKEYTIFNRNEKQAIVTDTTDPKNLKINNYKISENIEDMISAFYLLRNIPFEEKKLGDTVSLDVFMDDRCYNVNFKYFSKEKIKSKLGKIKSYVLQPIIAGETKEDSPIKVWISEDEKKIPLRVQLKLMLGSIELELEEYKINGDR